MPWEILAGRMTIFPQPPQYFPNPKKQGIYDIMSGLNGPEFNEFAKKGRLNLTVVRDQSFGTCRLNSSSSEIFCTGMRGRLFRNESDFTLAADELGNFDRRLPEYPVAVAGVVYEAIPSFTCLPSVEASQKMITALDIFASQPLNICLLVILVYLLSSFVINISPSGKHRIRLGPTSLWRLTLGSTSTQFKSDRRRLAFFWCILTAFVFKIIFSSNVTSDLVSVIPATYPESLQDILTMNRTPVFHGKGTLHRRYVQKNKRVIKELLRKGLVRNLTEPGSYKKISKLQIDPNVKGIPMHSHDGLWGLGMMLTCQLTNYNLTLVRKIKTFNILDDENVRVIEMRKTLSEDNPVLAARLEKIVAFYTESGIYPGRGPYHGIRSGSLKFLKISGDTKRLPLCAQMFGKGEEETRVLSPVDMQHFHSYFVLIILSLLPASLVLIIEITLHPIRYHIFPQQKPRRSPYCDHLKILRAIHPEPFNTIVYQGSNRRLTY